VTEEGEGCERDRVQESCNDAMGSSVYRQHVGVYVNCVASLFDGDVRVSLVEDNPERKHAFSAHYQQTK